jgi:two-component system chemotaxis response regulator CheY
VAFRRLRDATEGVPYRRFLTSGSIPWSLISYFAATDHEPCSRGGSKVVKTILIVDDSPTIRRMVMASLRSLRGLSFAEAESGLEAMERLAQGPADAMILDMSMPDMHGLEVIRLVRQQPTYRSLPILVLTTRDDEDCQADACDVGATLYMTKPFEPPALAAAVRRLLGENKDGGSEVCQEVRYDD